MTRRSSAVVGAAVALIAARPPAAAGWRESYVLVVDATPAAAGADGARCGRELGALVTGEDVIVTRRPLAGVARLIGPGAPAEVGAWTEAVLAPLRARRDAATYDAVIVFDCRPRERRLDVVIDPAAAGVVHYQLREVTIDQAALAWLMTDVMTMAWVGFEL